MNRRMPKLWQQATSAVLAVLFVVLVPLSTAFADTFPYFTTQNGGPFAGGGFRPGSGSCESNYQRPSFPTSTTVSSIYNGAIMAWANSNRSQSARSSLDAFATGVIEGNGSSSYGFYTGLSGTSALSFANFENFGNLGNPPFWGGIFEGANLGDAHCIPDYYGTKRTTTTGAVQLTGDRTFNNSNVNTACGDKQIIFVAGNVLIDGDITYDPTCNVTNVPKFAVVALGNIYVNSGVNRIDGWYIAQPNGATGGTIWTCSNGFSAPTASFIRTNCSNSLTVYGALTAKQVNLTRIAGSVGPGPVAETVNFTPEMVLGGAFFDQSSSGGSGTATGTIQSLISLPPIF